MNQSTPNSTFLSIPEFRHIEKAMSELSVSPTPSLVSTRPISCPPSEDESDDEIASFEQTTVYYNNSTWTMYNRIMLSRKNSKNKDYLKDQRLRNQTNGKVIVDAYQCPCESNLGMSMHSSGTEEEIFQFDM